MKKRGVVIVLFVLYFVGVTLILRWIGSAGSPPTMVAVWSFQASKYLYYAIDGDAVIRIKNVGGGEGVYCGAKETLVFLDDVGNIWRINRIGENAQKIFESGSLIASSLSWSGDCSHIAFLLRDTMQTSQVYVMDADGGNVTQITANGFYKIMVAFAPNGRRLVYISHGEMATVTIVDVQTRQEQMQPLDGVTTYAVRWSPDGTKLAISYYSLNTSLTIWVIRADSWETVFMQQCADNPLWSPDSQRLSYIDYCGHGSGELYVVRVDGGTAHRLTESFRSKMQLAWVDHRIIFVSFPFTDDLPTAWQIDAIDEDGSNLRPLTEGAP